MSLYCPPCADWRWFGSLDPEQIAALGTRQSEPSTWIKHAYAWLYERLDELQRIRVYDRAEFALREICNQEQVSFETYFPQPPGLREYRTEQQRLIPQSG